MDAEIEALQKELKSLESNLAEQRNERVHLVGPPKTKILLRDLQQG